MQHASSFWRLTPTAAPDDPRWLDHALWDEVIVKAPSAAEARLLAGALAAHKPERIANESAAGRTGFDDEKLYWVQQIAAPDVPADQPEGVIRAVKRAG
jgi:hypothetical protein